MNTDAHIEFFPVELFPAELFPAWAHGRVAGGDWPIAAHLVTPRKGFLHHGLYAGNGRVIHYAGLAGGLRRRTVEEVSLQEFARGHEVRVRSTPPTFTGEEVLRRARSRLGENRYRILSNNCEHFCEWCLRGRSRSPQAEALRTRPLIRGVAALIDVRIVLADLLRGMSQLRERVISSGKQLRPAESIYE
jgi:hypothetical protein